jgi:S-adenosylmethionine:tRNA ribosyltransferase-isomerase
LRGRTEGGESIELRLAEPIVAARLAGVLFGAGDHRTRTEDREPPPQVRPGDVLVFTGFEARVVDARGRQVVLEASVRGDALWAAIYREGAPVQYAHRPELLHLYDAQTAYAARPWCAEMPSAGRALTWDVLLRLRRAGIELATLTHAAGLSSTGDAALDAALPWPERYDVPQATWDAIAAARQRGGRVIAVGTTVVRALEAARGRAGEGVAVGRIGAQTRLEIVDGLISGLHDPGESHFELLQAFVERRTLERALALAAGHGLSSHELGDACLIV